MALAGSPMADFLHPSLPSRVLGLSDASSIVLLLLVLGVTYQTCSIIYNVFLHPLRNVPGPFWSRATRVPWALQSVRGTQPFRTKEAHDRYGPVVRIGPDHLSFTDHRAFEDIYGHRIGVKKAVPEMRKAGIFFDPPFPEFSPSIANADRENHARLRRALAHSFSEKELRKQEELMNFYLRKMVGRLCELSAEGPVDIESWVNYAAFDITGEMAMNLHFNCLEQAEFHVAIKTILDMLPSSVVSLAIQYLGFEKPLKAVFRMAGGVQAAKDLRKELDKMLIYRLQQTNMKDVMEELISRNDFLGLDYEGMVAHALAFLIGGADTIIAPLTGAIFFLLKNPDKMEKLKQEVNVRIKSESDITIEAVMSMPYLIATLKEALRLSPPLPSGLVRVIPEGGNEVAGVWAPAGTMVEVQQWAMGHSASNWENAQQFIPERFLGEDLDDNLEAYQPFSVGPRACLGRNLAYIMMRLTLCHIVYNFDMKLAEDSQEWFQRRRNFFAWERLHMNTHLSPAR
ncbi:hypothetical protein MCOR25_010108 [Pyricularia grisea]|nr:hypothetical protein MCOR25_010108 [Pyricularia grisea]